MVEQNALEESRVLAELREGRLARRLDAGIILPLAIEYPFWSEKTPEALLAFGRPDFRALGVPALLALAAIGAASLQAAPPVVLDPLHRAVQLHQHHVDR